MILMNAFAAGLRFDISNRPRFRIWLRHLSRLPDNRRSRPTDHGREPS
jgi:hypothetical protein